MQRSIRLPSFSKQTCMTEKNMKVSPISGRRQVHPHCIVLWSIWFLGKTDRHAGLMTEAFFSHSTFLCDPSSIHPFRMTMMVHPFSMHHDVSYGWYTMRRSLFASFACISLESKGESVDSRKVNAIVCRKMDNVDDIDRVFKQECSRWILQPTLYCPWRRCRGRRIDWSPCAEQHPILSDVDRGKKVRISRLKAVVSPHSLCRHKALFWSVYG